MDDTVATAEDIPINIDVLANDTFDPTTDVEVTDVSDPTNGTTSINPDGTVDYTPDPDFVGTDTFTYTVTVRNPDLSTTTETATVTVIVDEESDANPDNAQTLEDMPVEIDVLDNDDFDALTRIQITAVSDPANASISTYWPTIRLTRPPT